MNEQHFHTILLVSFAVIAALVFPILLFVITAPYGRHVRGAGGVTINTSLAWVIMEAPSALVFGLCYLLGDKKTGPESLVFLVLWEAHYLYRAFVFPFRRRGGQREMPLFVAGSGFLFTLGNSYLNGRYLFSFAPSHLVSSDWTQDPRFYAGVALFIAGYAINQWADHVLFHLRRPGETGYKIPRGGLYELISCPNYFGELIEWTGWALLTWSPAGLVFALWTAANLLPRARSHHRWYKERFPEYPAKRRAVIPFLF